MEIKDLKSGMIVKLRNGEALYVLAEVGCLYDNMGLRRGSFCFYNINLTHTTDNKKDIVKVYESYKLIWERKEIPKLTDEEKVILRNLKKDCKWITRDVVSDIEIYENKPIQMSTCDGYWSGVPDYELYAFNHMFESITLENSPILISDLLEGE